VAGDSSPAAARANTERLSAALNAQWSGGKFRFPRRPAGPILYPIRCAAKEFYFAGTIETSNRVGGVLLGGGGRSYHVTSDHYAPDGTLGGAVTRFTRIDGENGGAVLRLRGTGFILDGIDVRGRPYPAGTGETGTKTPSCIEVEGRTYPATGRHLIRNCTLAGANAGIRTLGGYYENGAFVKNEIHADESIVDGVNFATVDSCFRSENQQALNWTFRDITVNVLDGTDTVVFDIVRGGNIYATNVSLNHNKVTLLKVYEYSPNTQRFVCDNFRWDTFAGAGDYLCLFQYAGPAGEASWKKWTARISGHIANERPQTYDAAKLIQITPGVKDFPLDDVLLDVARLPEQGFRARGNWKVKN